MDVVKEKKRWPIAFIIITAVVIASAAMIYSYRDSLSRLPVSAISDGSGGAIVAWQHEGGIHAQRLDTEGQAQWEAGGVFVCDCPPGSGFSLTSDSLGGAIITWSGRRVDDPDDPAYYDPVPFYARRITAGGKLLWNDSPIAAGTSQEVSFLVAREEPGNYNIFVNGLSGTFTVVAPASASAP